MTSDDVSDRCCRCGAYAWETGLERRLCMGCGAYEVAFGRDDWMPAGAREGEEAARGAEGAVEHQEGDRGGPAPRSADYESMFKALALGERNWEES